MIKNYKNFTIHIFDELESTNKTAFELAQEKKKFDHEIILAKKQNAGRGRENRVWSSGEGNLYFSLILQPKISANKIPQLSFVAIAALMLTLQKIVKNKISLKWPNDLLIEEKKVSGLLLESKISGNDCEFVILGIGLNTDSNPDNTIFPASNLKKFGYEISPQDVLEKFLDELEILYQNWLDFGFEAIRKLWLKNAFRLNEKISVKQEETLIEGIFENLDEEGNLIIKSQGKQLKISAADVLQH